MQQRGTPLPAVQAARQHKAKHHKTAQKSPGPGCRHIAAPLQPGREKEETLMVTIIRWLIVKKTQTKCRLAFWQLMEQLLLGPAAQPGEDAPGKGKEGQR